MLLILVMTFSFVSFANCQEDAYLPKPEIIQIKSWNDISSHINSNERVVLQVSKREFPFVDSRPYTYEGINDPEYQYKISTYKHEENVSIIIFQPWVRPKRFILSRERFELYNFIPFKLNGSYADFETHYLNAFKNFESKYKGELFEKIYQVQGSSFKEHAAYSLKSPADKIVEKTKDKRVLGLAIHPRSNRLIEFSGYSHGVIQKSNGIKYLELYIERETFYISLNNILSLKTAVY